MNSHAPDPAIDASDAPEGERPPKRGRVVATCAGATHDFSKSPRDSITLVEGLGVEGDAHCGATVKHRSRVARDPTQPNLRQVHLLSTELLAPLVAAGYRVSPCALGENVTTEGIDLPSLPAGTRLHLGEGAIVEVTGLRNPCHQLDDFQPGLTAAVLGRSPEGKLLRKAGVMSIVIRGGDVRVGDAIRVELPPEPHRELDRV